MKICSVFLVTAALTFYPDPVFPYASRFQVPLSTIAPDHPRSRGLSNSRTFPGSELTYQPCSDHFERLSSDKVGELKSRLHLHLNRPQDENFTHWTIEMNFTDTVNMTMSHLQVKNNSTWIDELPVRGVINTTDNQSYTLKFYPHFNAEHTVHLYVYMNILYPGRYIDISNVKINNISLCSDREICGEFATGGDYIHHGETARRGEWPWLAALYRHNISTLSNFYCAGTLVSDRHVITAAHCIRFRNEYCEIFDRKDIIVVLGLHDRKKDRILDRQMYRVSQAVVHDDYINFENVYNDADIAVFVLDRRVEFNSFIKPACLNFDFQQNIIGKTAGWGLTENGTTSEVVKVVTMPLITTQMCRQASGEFTPITSNRTFCAGFRDGSGPCKGDSGGGFYTIVTSPGDRPRFVLAGIVSRGLLNNNFTGICNLHFPVVFTRISSYKVWFEEEVGGIRSTYLNESINLSRIIEAINSNNTEALTQYDKGNYEDALSLFDEVHHGRKCILGDEHGDTLLTSWWVADTLRKTTDYEEALASYDLLLPTMKRILGEDNPNTLNAMNNKALTLSRLGRHNEALDLYNKVIEKKTRVLGVDHVDTLQSMQNKAFTLSNIGRYIEALDLYNDVIEKQTRVLGVDHVDTLQSMQNKAFTLSNMGRYNESIDLYNKVIEKQNRVLGVDHVDTLQSMHNKAFTLENMGRYNEALDLYNKVIEKKTGVLGVDHVDTLRSMHNKASTLGKMGRQNESLDLDNEVIEKRIRVLGVDHVDTLKSMHNKASTLNQMGRHNEALDLYNEVIEKRIRVLGVDHVDTLNSMHSKATTLDNMGRYNEALDLCNKVIEKRTRVLGVNHVDTLQSMHNKASTLYNMGRYNEALSLYNEVIEKRTRVLGVDHVDTLQSIQYKAFTLNKMGHYSEALDLYNRVIEKRTRVLGPDHKSTLLSISNNSATVAKMGR